MKNGKWYRNVLVPIGELSIWAFLNPTGVQYSCVFVARKKIPIEITLYDSFICFYLVLQNFFTYTFDQVLKFLTFRERNLRLNAHIYPEV